MRDNKVRMIVEGGIMLALAVILNSIRLYKMPQGGSITLGGYVPLFLFALRWGLGPGIILGALYGVIDFMIDPVFLTPIQVFLDYILSYGMFGLAGIGKNEKTDEGTINLGMISGLILGSIGRLLAAVVSGYVFFREYLPQDVNPIIASFMYNLTYIIPNVIICLIITFLIIKPISRVNRR
ncbi:MAG: energy-coupled thiamine transporter ThiT [Tissierellia bacterium]|nr:energy-coupled thiamine transporter ThiT [Tissierellia bacterium]